MDDTFLSRFAFRPRLRGHLGVEREFFLVDPDICLPAPRAEEFLRITADPSWTYELSACQVEHRTAPCPSIDALMRDIKAGEDRGKATAYMMGLRLVSASVGPPAMPLDVYPDPRYRSIAATLPMRVLSAACRVAGTHIHVGVSSMDEAVALHDAVVDELPALVAEGDLSRGFRMRLYGVMAPDHVPPKYGTAEAFADHARSEGFDANPRNCWHLVRISVHGTVELRMFGATADRKRIKRWAKRALGILGRI